MTDHDVTPNGRRREPSSLRGESSESPGPERTRNSGRTRSTHRPATDGGATGRAGNTGRAKNTGRAGAGGTVSSTPRGGRGWSSGTPGAADRLPTRTSSRIAAFGTAGVILLLLWWFSAARIPFLVGAVGAVCLAVGIRLARRHASPLVTFGTALLAVPIALGLFGGPFLVAIGLVDTIFPVPDPSLLSLGSLLILSYAGIVTGCSLAVFGLALGGLTSVTPGSLERFSSTTFVAGIPSASIGIVLAGGAALGGAPGEESIISHLSGILAGFILSTNPAALNLGSFLLSLAAALLGLRLCLVTLPVAELLTDTGSPGETDPVLDRTKAMLTVGFVATAAPGGFALGVEISQPAGTLAGVVGPTLSDGIRVLTTARWIRRLLLILTVGTFAAAGVGYTIRRFGRASSVAVRNRLTAVLAGIIVAAVAISGAEALYAAIVDDIARRLPRQVTPFFEDQAAAFATSLGEATIIVILTAALIGATGFAIILLRGLIGAGMLSAETPGYSLASAGLFLAVLSAAPVGLASWLVFVGVAGSLLVWDVGRFGSTLAREIGRESAHRSTDLVHATGTVLVGVVAVLAAIVARAVVGTGIAPASDSHLVALGSLLIGLLGLVEALRLS